MSQGLIPYMVCVCIGTTSVERMSQRTCVPLENTTLYQQSDKCLHHNQILKRLPLLRFHCDVM